MKLVSHQTLVTAKAVKNGDRIVRVEPVEHAPGTPVDVPSADAKSLIDRGIARPYRPAPTVEAEGGEGGGA